MIWIQIHWILIWSRILALLGSESMVTLSSLKKNVFKKLRWGKVPLKEISFLKQEYNGTGRSFLVSWVTEWWIFVYNLKSFASYLSYIYLCGSGSVFGIQIRICTWIWIQFGSEFTTLCTCSHLVRVGSSTTTQTCTLVTFPRSSSGLLYC